MVFILSLFVCLFFIFVGVLFYIFFGGRGVTVAFFSEEKNESRIAATHLSKVPKSKVSLH